MRFLFDRVNFERFHSMPYCERDFKLVRMERLLEHLGRPEERFPIIHIAGTKGKGSTGAVLESILKHAGFRVGGFHSPHLERIEERFLIDGNPCEEGVFVETVLELQERLADWPDDGQFSAASLTFFELTAAVALMLFDKCGVDVAVVEVGLGGRLDATNACRPMLSIITSIGLEHTRELGSTLEAIAREKAGIIKPEVPVVIGDMAPEPLREIERIADRLHSPRWSMPRDYHVLLSRRREASPASEDFGSRSPGWDFSFFVEKAGSVLEQPFGSDLALSLAGRHQVKNTAVALMALTLLRQSGWEISDQAVSQGLLAARCAGRAEWFVPKEKEEPWILLDGAHNRDSVAALLEVIDEAPVRFGRRRLLFATTLGKDLEGMLSLLVPRFDEICFTRYSESPRAVPPEELRSLARRIASAKGPAGEFPILEVNEPPEAALRSFRESSEPEDLICLTGSMYIAGQLRSAVADRRRR